MRKLSKKLKVIILLGSAGSGKGTQAKLLVKEFGLEYFGSGDALRVRKKTRDFTGKKLTKVMDQGLLVPSFAISKLWIDALAKFKKRKKFKGFVIDGSPRKIGEAEFLDEAIKWYEWQKYVKVVLVNISKKESTNRLTKRRACRKCGRLIPWLSHFKKIRKCDKCGGQLIIRRDDKLSAIKKRLEEFKNEVIPVINYYKKQRKLKTVNGEQSIEDVFKDILKVVK